MRRHARINPELIECLDRDPEIAIILQTISLCNIIQEVDFIMQIIWVKQVYYRLEKYKGMRDSKSSFSSTRRRPNSFRIVVKSKSGFISNEEQLGKNMKLSESKLSNFSSIEQPKDVQQNKQIKAFVKQMKDRLPNKEPTIRNEISTRKESKESNRNKKQLSFSKTLSESSYRPVKPRLSLMEIENKIDHLLELKISNLESGDRNKSLLQEIDKQIKQIVFFLHNQWEDENNGEQLDLAARKIKILQKIMAQSMAESELAKKTYFHILHRKRPPKNRISSENIDIKLLKLKNSSFKSPIPIHYETIAQTNYKAPDKKSYPEGVKRPEYQFKNQPLHRSTYNRDYLTFGSVPNFPFHERSSQLLGPYSKDKKNSCYQNDYTNKKVEKINFKELDCYRNKIKNLPISFNTHRGQNMKLLQKIQSKHNFSASENLNQQKRLKTEPAHYIKNLSTSNRVNFTGQNNQIVSRIKHKDLYDFKYRFKTAIHG